MKRGDTEFSPGAVLQPYIYYGLEVIDVTTLGQRSVTGVGFKPVRMYTFEAVTLPTTNNFSCTVLTDAGGIKLGKQSSATWYTDANPQIANAYTAAGQGRVQFDNFDADGWTYTVTHSGTPTAGTVASIGYVCFAY